MFAVSESYVQLSYFSYKAAMIISLNLIGIQSEGHTKYLIFYRIFVTQIWKQKSQIGNIA